MKLGDLNIAQKIILGIGTLAFTVRCFTYESRYFNASVVFHCLAIMAITAFLMLLFRRKEENARQEQEEIEPPPRKKPKVKRFLIAGSVLFLLVIGVILIIQWRYRWKKSTWTWNAQILSVTGREENPKSNEVQSRKSGGLTPEIYNQLRLRGYTDYQIIQRLREREDIEAKYQEWLGERLGAPQMIDRIIEMDTARRISDVKLSPSDVELFDMRLLDGTGGYKALSGRVQNKSAKVIEEIRLGITLYNLAGKPIDSGTATISCSIPPFAVRSVTGDVTEMTPILSVTGRKEQ